MKRFRISVFYLVVSALLCGAASMAKAQSQLPINGSVSGVPGDTYTLTIPADGAVVFTAQPTSQLAIYLQIYDADGVTLIGGSSPAGPGVAVTATLDHPGPGVYSIKVIDYHGGGSYTLSDVYTSPTVANDPEPNDTPQTATPIKAGDTATGHLGYSHAAYNNQDSVDYYKVSIPSDGDLTYTVAPDPALRSWVDAYDVDGASIIGGTNPTIPGAVERVTIPHLGHGTYYFAVFLAGGEGGYTLQTTWRPQTAQNDSEPNDAIQTATPIHTPGSATGHLGYSRTSYSDVDPADYYKITLSSAGTLDINVDPTPNLSVYIWLYDAAGVRPIAIVSQGRPGQAVRLTVPHLPAGTYYAAVNLYIGYGAYRVSVLP